MSLLRLVAHTYHLTASEATRAYFDGTNEAEKTVGFKQLLNNYFQQCCDEYIITHQQIIDGKKQLSSLSEENLDEYVYCVIQKIMHQNNGHKHLNCIFDGAMIVCVIQFKYVLNSLANNPIQMGSSRVSRGGLFPDAEATLLRYIFDQHLNAANEKLCLNNDQYKNLRLTCGENSACGLDFANEKQRQKQLREAIDLEGQAHQSS
jgi:hypothetical protein